MDHLHHRARGFICREAYAASEPGMYVDRQGQPVRLWIGGRVYGTSFPLITDT